MQETTQQDNNIDAKKSSYDGRLKFFELTHMWMMIIANASINNQYEVWLRALRALRGIVAGFVMDKRIIEIKKDIYKLEVQINSVLYSNLNNVNKQKAARYFDNQLQDITDELYIISKDLWLPTKSDKDKLLDLDKLFGG